jgi:hypothetical protein
MKKFIDFYPWLFVYACLFISSSLLAWQLFTIYQKSKVIPHVYQHKSTICKTAEQTECGVYLKECENGKTYACLNELTIVRGEK